MALLKALHHPHICQLYDVIDDGDKVYLVQEYVTGGELYDYAHKVPPAHTCMSPC